MHRVTLRYTFQGKPRDGVIHSAGAKQQNSEHTDSTCTPEPPDIHTDFYEYRDPFFICGIYLAVFNMKRTILLCPLTAGTRAVTYNPFGIGEKHESWSLCTAGQPGDKRIEVQVLFAV